jgi:hypothetical protein
MAQSISVRCENVVNTDTAPNLGQSLDAIVTADWDRGTEWTVAHSKGSVQMSKPDFLGYDFAQLGSTLVVEGAHLKPRNGRSVSQIYTADELASWEPGVDVRMFEGRYTHVASKYAGNTSEGTSDKTKDAQSLYAYLRDHTRTLNALKRFAVDEGDFGFRNIIRDEASLMLNVLRYDWNGMGIAKWAIPSVAHCKALLDEAFVNPKTEDCFEFELVKGTLRFNISQVMTLYVCLFNEGGHLRRHPSGVPLGTKYVMDKVIELHLCRKGNLLRSNLVYHGMRHKCPKLDITKAEYTTAVRHLLQALRAQGRSNEAGT